ncbi:MAG: hypothetical protein EBY29_16125, partial [Planctomycetes bacterium]|nr:hypothetical protein [Planctomycetota bacterium]
NPTASRSSILCNAAKPIQASPSHCAERNSQCASFTALGLRASTFHSNKGSILADYGSICDDP